MTGTILRGDKSIHLDRLFFIAQNKEDFMKVTMYYEELKRELYNFFAGRVKDQKVPEFTLDICSEVDSFSLSLIYVNDPAYQRFTNELQKQHLIEFIKPLIVSVDMKRVMKLFYSEYQVEPFGVVFTSTNPEGILNFTFTNGRGEFNQFGICPLNDAIEVQAGSYLHAVVKQKMYAEHFPQGMLAYTLTDNVHERRYY
jgi:hypothetical protein